MQKKKPTESNLEMPYLDKEINSKTSPLLPMKGFQICGLSPENWQIDFTYLLVFVNTFSCMD